MRRRVVEIFLAMAAVTFAAGFSGTVPPYLFGALLSVRTVSLMAMASISKQ
jgi:hypothetical protein